MPPNQDKTSNGKHIEQYRRPQLLCVLLVQTIYAIDLALIPLLGNVAEIQKISYESPRSIYGETSNERESECIFIPLKIAKRKRYKNADEGVILVAIQIAVESDLSAEQRRLCVQQTYSPGTSPPS